MAKRPSKIPTLKNVGGHITTFPVGEEGIPQILSIQHLLTTLIVGEENPVHPTTLALGEEGPTIWWGEHPSNIITEHPSAIVAEQFGPITDPGGPVEAQAATKTAAKRKRKSRR